MVYSAFHFTEVMTNSVEVLYLGYIFDRHCGNSTVSLYL